MSEQAVESPKKKAVETIKVTMADGRVLDWPVKRKMQKEIIEDGDAVRFDFVDGSTKVFRVPEQHKKWSAGHGYAQKLGDSVAGLKDESGNPAEAEDMLLTIEELHQRLDTTPDWNVAATGGSAGGGSIIIKAIMEHTGKSLEATKAYIEDKLANAEAKGEKLTRQALYTAFRDSKALKPIIRRLEDEKAEKSKTKINVDDDLMELATS